MTIPAALTTKDAIYAELSGEDCRCGARKKKGKTFCGKCYLSLPVELRDQLYQQQGYIDTYLKAVKFLDS